MAQARDRGSAVLAAVLAASCFALLAAQMARTSRSSIQGVNAGLAHARLAADADAGLALAVDGLLATNQNAHWDIDRTPHSVDFNGAELSITIEDERGKVPLNIITPAQITMLFQKGGAEREAVPGLVEAFLDYRDPNRSQAPQPAAHQPVSPTTSGSGGFQTVEELAALSGMTPSLYAAIFSSVSVNSGDTPFDERTATPLALEVMEGDEAGPKAIERQRELQGEKTALEVDSPISLTGRALTIRVTASDGSGARVEKATIVELTGRPDRPYVVRQQDAGYA